MITRRVWRRRPQTQWLQPQGEPKLSSLRYGIGPRGNGAAKRRAGKDGLNTRLDEDEERNHNPQRSGQNH